jgi:hypothetical protein
MRVEADHAGLRHTDARQSHGVSSLAFGSGSSLSPRLLRISVAEPGRYAARRHVDLN